MDVETHNLGKSKRSAWISAMRLRTLPLALASTVTGSSMAALAGAFSWTIALMTATTTVLLQINSNLANDYGDFLQGTDSEDRIGPERALQSGVLSAPEVKRSIVLFSLLSFISGSALLYLAPIDFTSKLVLLVAGILAIYASIKYTAGSNPYGYRGLGDLSVMLFFGVLGVVGAFYVQSATLSWSVLLPAIGIGCFSAGVLNVNNTRDRSADMDAGKITIAVKLGAENSRRYQVFLMGIGISCFTLYASFFLDQWQNWIFLISLPLFALNAYKVYTIREDVRLDPWLKQLALSTFLLSLLLALGASF